MLDFNMDKEDLSVVIVDFIREYITPEIQMENVTHINEKVWSFQEIFEVGYEIEDIKYFLEIPQAKIKTWIEGKMIC